MVTLFVKNKEQTTLLESALINLGIGYTVDLDDGRYGLTTPYVLVHGAPLDEERAFKWLMERDKQ